MDGDKHNPNLVRAWRIWRTSKEMMHDRGYLVLEEDMAISLDDFARRFAREDGDPDKARLNFSCQPSEDMLLKHTPAPTKKEPNPAPEIGMIWVEFNGDENVGLKQIREYMQHLLDGHFYSGIMVTVKQVTGMALRLLRGTTSIAEGPKGGVEIFVEQELLINLTKHELVPKHILLSAAEKEQLLQRYRLKQTQLPRIQTVDPVAKYLGLRRGAVVKIIRKSETAGRYASYRWVI